MNDTELHENFELNEEVKNLFEEIKKIGQNEGDEMTKEIEKYSLFEHLNMEKITPHFLKLAKCTRRR